MVINGNESAQPKLSTVKKWDKTSPNRNKSGISNVDKFEADQASPGAVGAPVKGAKGRQTVCKPGSVPRANALRRSFIWTGGRPPVLATHPDGGAQARPGFPPCRPYSVLLQAGLAVPPSLRSGRCALTAPFHPYPRDGGRSVLCGAVPGVAPGGGYPPPCLRGARTFLPRGLSAPAAAIAQPSDAGPM